MGFNNITQSSLPRPQESKRHFLRTLMLLGGIISASLVGLLPVFAKLRLRPPGALVEKDFLAACIKCGQCVQVCPVQAIRLADIDEGAGLGVPYIHARDQACDFSCDILQCTLACPTGALSHSLDKKEEVRMGIAHVDKPEACLAYQGLGFKGLARGAEYKGLLRYQDVDRWKPTPIKEYFYDLELCDLCVRHCPIENAIALDITNGKHKVPMIYQACVGCGTCEMMCPVEPAVIVVDGQGAWCYEG